jgi:tRNA-modifying protein YgfZ
MIDDPTQALRALLLPGFGVLRIAGPDAVTFLQGQLTNDVRLLEDGRTQVTACCTPQGRVLALLRLRQTDAAIYALLPADMLPKLATHLRKFVLRAKVEIVQAADLHVGAIVADDAYSATQTQRALDEAALTMSPVPLSGTTEVVAFQYSPDREVLAAPAGAWRSISGLSLSRPGARAQAEWLADDIARGLPQVVAATSAQFTPQMLNVDLLEGVSYTKGCYTGQEIVARTHHLGRVKRRTMRYRLAAGGEPPELLSSLALDGARVGDVLMTAATDSGIELLAVTNLDAAGKTLKLEDGRSAEPQPLPYDL